MIFLVYLPPRPPVMFSVIPVVASGDGAGVPGGGFICICLMSKEREQPFPCLLTTG